MAVTPVNGYVKEVKIGGQPAKVIAAPLMIEEEGGVTKFYAVAEIKDFTEVVEVAAPAEVWTLTFPTGVTYYKKTPSVTCVNSDKEQILGDVKYAADKIVINFNKPLTGYAYFN